MEFDKSKEEVKTPPKNITPISPSNHRRPGSREPNEQDKSKAPDYKYMRDKNRELVKGIFRFYEIPGGLMEFVFKEFKNEPVEKYSMTDGHIYSIPLGVAKHLNKNGWYPIHAHAVDENGVPRQRIGKKVRRFGFQSLEFVDTGDIESGDTGLITIENI